MTDDAVGASRTRTLEHKAVIWLQVERPDAADLAALQERFGLHPLDLEDLVSTAERPKLDLRAGYCVAVLHLPVQLSRPRRLAAGELHLFVGPDFVITVHDGDLRPPLRLFDDLEADPSRRAVEMASPARLAYAMVIGLIEASESLITRLSSAVELLQEEIFAQEAHEPVRQLVSLRREVIQLGRMLRPDAAVVDALTKAPFAGGPEIAAYWGNAGDQIHRLADYLEDAAETLQALSRAYDQLAVQRINNATRLVTAASAVLLPVVVISGIYAMNVRGLPGAESDWAFEITLAVILAVAIGLLAWFRRRRWL